MPVLGVVMPIAQRQKNVVNHRKHQMRDEVRKSEFDFDDGGPGYLARPRTRSSSPAHLAHRRICASAEGKGGSEPIGWIAREIEFLKAWEAERFEGRLF